MGECLAAEGRGPQRLIPGHFIQRCEVKQELRQRQRSSRASALTIDFDKRRVCPKCPDIVLMRHYYSKKRGVVVDECPNGGGFWLDAGELEQVRAEREALEAEETSKAIISRMDVKYHPKAQTP